MTTERWITLVSGVLLLLMAVGFIAAPSWDMSPREKISRVEVEMFALGEVFPAEQVKPGTFRIDIPVIEFQKRLLFDQTKKAIITYTSNNTNGIVLEYWLPKANGEGVFYHAQETISLNWSERYRYRVRLTHQENTLVATGEYILDRLFYPPAVLLGTMGIGLAIMTGFLPRRKASSPVA